MDDQKLANLFKSQIKGQVRFNEPMSNHTSFRIGGPADVLVVPEDADDIRGVLKIADENRLPLTVLGNGSIPTAHSCSTAR